MINGRLVFFKNIKIFSSKISNNYNFIFISDIHLGSNVENHLKNILKKISKIKYDFLLIGGDLIDSSNFDIKKLSIFKSIEKPIFFVSGNHEYYLLNYNQKFKEFNNFGIKILKNESVLFKELNIIGIDDRQSNTDKYKKSYNLTSKLKFNLLLVHKPSIWNNIKDNIDLMISGHTHNGQIFPFNFFVKLQFRYTYGLYKNFNSNLYVSSGSGCWGPRIRLGTSNEVVLFELKKQI